MFLIEAEEIFRNRLKFGNSEHILARNLLRDLGEILEIYDKISPLCPWCLGAGTKYDYNFEMAVEIVTICEKCNGLGDIKNTKLYTMDQFKLKEHLEFLKEYYLSE